MIFKVTKDGKKKEYDVDFFHYDPAKQEVHYKVKGSSKLYSLKWTEWSELMIKKVEE